MTITESPDSSRRAERQDIPTSRVRLPRRERESQMTEVATSVFGRLGYHGASMDQIADEAGISKPMLYAYFDSKEGLYAACLKRAGCEAVAQVRAAYDPDHEPEQHLWYGFKAYFEFLRDNRSAWQLIHRDTGYDTTVEDLGDAARHDLRGAIAELTRMSSLAIDGDPFSDDNLRESLAHAMLGGAEALAAWWLEGHPELPVENLCASAMNLFWIGLAEVAEGQGWTNDRINSLAKQA